MRHLNLHAREFLKVMLLAGVPYMLWMGQSYALTTLDNRSVTISTATPSAVATHVFQMTPVSTDPVGSIKFEYCANSPLFDEPCDPPAGLSLSGAALDSQTGNPGFVLDTAASDATDVVIKRPPASMADVASTYGFSGVVNPPLNNQTTYVRISTYLSTNASGSYTDRGAVAFSTNTNFEIGAYVPPFLNLCVGVTVASDCSQTQGDSLDLGVLSPQAVRAATSQFAASTNAATGYDLFVLGTTMTSGNNVITPLTNTATSRPGIAQFGINLRKNSSPNVGNEPSGTGTAVPSAGYGSPNLYSFVPGSQLSNSPLPTDYNQMTVSYIVNVPAGQAPGVYSTTLTYLASAQF